ncbi:MAG TPA: response regulator [Polyangia bacterium]|nr:response regulator [Polyangia bacterium]
MVVDDDPWIQRIVARTLGQRGHQVSLAGDAPGAFVVGSKIKPDLIITSTSLPAIEGWAWWERLRALPACADAPIIFLGSDLDAAVVMRGAGPRDQRLRKPFRAEDLERAVVTALGGGTVHTLVGQPTAPADAVEVRPSAGHRPLSALRGALDQLSLSSVLTVLEMERKTGILLVEREAGVARLFIRKGHVIRADSEQPRLTGAAAVYEALTWRTGSFDFLIGDIGGVDEIQASTTFLLLEGARRLDESNEDRRAGARESKI